MSSIPHPILTDSWALSGRYLRVLGLSPLPMIGSAEVVIKTLRIDQIIDQKGRAANMLWLGNSFFEENGVMDILPITSNSILFLKVPSLSMNGRSSILPGIECSSKKNLAAPLDS